MSTLPAANAKTERISFSRLLWVGPLAGLVAAIANLIIFGLAKTVIGIPFVIPLFGPGSPPEPLPAFMVIAGSLVPALGAAVLLWILGKFASRPLRIFWIVSLLFLLLSLGGPLSLPVDLPTKLALSLMHVVAAVAIVGVLTTLGPEKK
jgi:hypothetical protein